MNNLEVYLNFIKEIEIFERNNNSKSYIFDVLSSFLLNSYTNVSNYILEKMVEYNLINPKIIKTKKSPYFANYMTKEEINNIKFPVFRRQILDNYGELSKNDWELHKQLIAEGHNPNEIAKIIRNDEIEKLQEMSSQNDFDFNQYIEESLYEKCDFINLYNVKLIDYAAFFGSIKCFKYLLINGGKLNNTGQYAIASGNEEIIHLCEQNHSSFEDAYETAIKFHRNDIFKYIYENKIIEIKDLTELAIICIQLHNYEIFLFLLEKGMKIKKVIINESARIGNLYLANYFLKTIKFPNDILVYSSQSGNIELVKYVLSLKKINLNFKYACESLLTASRYGYIEITKLLLDQDGIDANYKNFCGETALIIVTKYGYTEIVKLLLEQKGIDINVKSLRGETALILAAKNGYTEIVKLLLEQKGIDINATDNNGYTALMHAKRCGNKEIEKLFLAH